MFKAQGFHLPSANVIFANQAGTFLDPIRLEANTCARFPEAVEIHFLYDHRTIGYELSESWRRQLSGVAHFLASSHDK